MKQNNDQDLANIRDTVPRLWWAIYQGAMDAGFKENQAIAALTAWIMSQCPNGIRPDNPVPPKPE